ncbi:MAG: DNA mismatch repair endonuclease MutL [Deltaproteobacteria bacterium]|nr:DNA mismatch repair endonuclease MutL [Deltaproteobacteria bacterium]
MRVRVLSDDLINRISAGEVVDRPVSVVRELVDNAIDAGASEIQVRLEDGGQTLISVSDNGSGMERDDAILALERHATSKLSDPADLVSIATLGFRGEALPSIAAVSKVRLCTRTAQATGGAEIIMEGGRLKDVRSCAAAPGTEITVRSLFFNTPARRKFLKQPATEVQHVKSWLTRAALAWPAIHFRLSSDGREILNLAPRASSIERAKALVRGSLVCFDKSYGSLGVSGLVGHPGLAQADLSVLVTLVNRRLVSDRLILRAVRDGFGSTLKDREYPVGMISLSLPLDEVDVNVHPQKSEVRYKAERQVFAAVRDTVSQALADFSAPMPGRHLSYPSVSAGAWQLKERATVSGMAEPTLDGRQAPAVPLRFDFCAPPESAGLEPHSFRFSELRYIGQALECYLLCEHERNLYVIDMHAAHERANYNMVRRDFAAGQLSSQLLLTPLVIDLTEDGLQNCLQHQEVLQRFGFEVEAFGKESLMVRAVPALLTGTDVTGLIKELSGADLSELAEGRISERLDYVAARIACHASVRAGRVLAREEAQALLKKLDDGEYRMACPHGRPVVVQFAEAEVEKWFGRDR